MFDNNVKIIEKLSNIQFVIDEIDCVIFTRKNKEYISEALKNFENVLDNFYIENNIRLSDVSNDKEKLLLSYENLLRKFIEEIESLYANIMEKIQIIETNQCVVFLKKQTMKSVRDIYTNSSEDEKERVTEEILNLNLSLNNIVYEIKEKSLIYNEILDLCEYEKKVCEKTVEVEIEKFYIGENDIKSNLILNKNISLEIFNYMKNYLDNLENNFVNNLVYNIELYTTNFNEKIDSMLNKSVHS